MQGTALLYQSPHAHGLQLDHRPQSNGDYNVHYNGKLSSALQAVPQTPVYVKSPQGSVLSVSGWPSQVDPSGSVTRTGKDKAVQHFQQRSLLFIPCDDCLLGREAESSPLRRRLRLASLLDFCSVSEAQLMMFPLFLIRMVPFVLGIMKA